MLGNATTRDTVARPRVLIVVTVGETLATILRGQPRFLTRELDVHVACARDQFFQLIAQNEGVSVHCVPMYRGISPLADIRALATMILLLRKVRPAMVHSYTPKAGLIAMCAAWLCRIRTRVHTFTGLVFPTCAGLNRMLIWGADRLTAAFSTLVIAEGRGVAEDLFRFRVTQGIPPVIGYGNIAGVDTSYFCRSNVEASTGVRGIRAHLHIPKAAFVYCFVGRVHREKGLRELIAAFCALPFSAHLLIVGQVDATAPPDSETLTIMRGHPRVHELGFCSDIRSALCAANVLVLPSYREGFPNVVLQSLSMGLPVIASSVNGCTEVVNETNGWLVPPRDDEALRSAMVQAYSSPRAVLDAMGRSGRKTILDRFEQASHWKRMLAFYKALLAAEQRG